MFDGISVLIGAAFVTIRECLLKKEPQPIILYIFLLFLFVTIMPMIKLRA